MTAYPEIYVLRHGQTEWNVAGRHQGRSDSPLTEVGRAQARRQGAILKSAGVGGRGLPAYCSPQGRAAATADLALAPIAAVPTLDDRLREVSMGAWEGLTMEEIEARRPELFFAGIDPLMRHFEAPGGESFDATCARCLDFLESLTAPSVIVTHGITSRVLRGLWLGLGADGMCDMPGGQGCVYHLCEGRQTRLSA
ncbi:MAG: histidine phosphatase family protein [Paracoccaceae bacterium]